MRNLAAMQAERIRKMSDSGRGMPLIQSMLLAPPPSASSSRQDPRGPLSLEKEPLDLAALAAEVVERVQAASRRHVIRLGRAWERCSESNHARRIDPGVVNFVATAQWRLLTVGTTEGPSGDGKSSG